MCEHNPQRALLCFGLSRRHLHLGEFKLTEIYNYSSIIQAIQEPAMQVEVSWLICKCRVPLHLVANSSGFRAILTLENQTVGFGIWFGLDLQEHPVVIAPTKAAIQFQKSMLLQLYLKSHILSKKTVASNLCVPELNITKLDTLLDGKTPTRLTSHKFMLPKILTALQ